MAGHQLLLLLSALVTYLALYGGAGVIFLKRNAAAQSRVAEQPLQLLFIDHAP
jgi:hypothetical protein